MRKRIYRYFPRRDIHFEQRYRYYYDLPYLTRTMAGMDGKFGMFSTTSPDLKGRMIQAKRELFVYICEDGVEFSSLNIDTVDSVIGDIEPEGTLDFKISLKYSYLDGRFNRVAFSGDDYLVRITLEGDLLILQIILEAGSGRTECGRIADTMLEELRKAS